MAEKKGKTAAPEAAPETPVAKAPEGPKMVTLKEICADLGIAPMSARRKLRSKLEKTSDFRWEFTEDQVDAIKEILTAKEAAPAPKETAEA